MPYEAAYTAICPALTGYNPPSGLLAGKIRALMSANVKIQLLILADVGQRPDGPRRVLYQEMTI
jgi:hypothetical protein